MTDLPVVRVGDLSPRPPEARWLVESLWPEAGVGFVAGQPKSCKSWFGLDLATSVASGTDCLDRFAVTRPGPALVYLAEDSPAEVRARVAGLCRRRALDLATLDLHVVVAPSLLLDRAVHQDLLRAKLDQLRPRLLLLDPLVRLHSLDENSAQEVSRLLGFLRELQRSFDLAIAVVHHTSKRTCARPGQGLRGSSDLHAWLDVGAYLTWSKGDLTLSLEHRSAAEPPPLRLALVSDPDSDDAHLAVDGDPPPASSGVATSTPLDLAERPLDERVVAALRPGRPIRRGALRAQLRVNNQRLGKALKALEERGLVSRTPAGWSRGPATRNLPGETEAGSAGEQPAEG